MIAIISHYEETSEANLIPSDSLFVKVVFFRFKSLFESQVEDINTCFIFK